jgi:hypothetical protein
MEMTKAEEQDVDNLLKYTHKASTPPPQHTLPLSDLPKKLFCLQAFSDYVIQRRDKKLDPANHKEVFSGEDHLAGAAHVHVRPDV